jgi:hypothetical protein
MKMTKQRALVFAAAALTLFLFGWWFLSEVVVGWADNGFPWSK